MEDLCVTKEVIVRWPWGADGNILLRTKGVTCAVKNEDDTKKRNKKALLVTP